MTTKITLWANTQTDQTIIHLGKTFTQNINYVSLKFVVNNPLQVK